MSQKACVPEVNEIFLIRDRLRRFQVGKSRSFLAMAIRKIGAANCHSKYSKDNGAPGENRAAFAETSRRLARRARTSRARKQRTQLEMRFRKFVAQPHREQRVIDSLFDKILSRQRDA